LEASISGCRLKLACFDLEINFKTFLRWRENEDKKCLEDKRKGPITVPKNKLTEEEKDEIIKVATSEDYMDVSPHIIVAKLADKGIYIASESSFYKVLRERELLEHRGKSKAPSMERPAPLIAYGPNQIWSWDITYMKSNIRGQFFYLYLFMDIFSRKIVGYDVFEEESMENSSCLFEKIAINESINKGELSLHADNGGAMKGSTMIATLDKLGVAFSFSRPRVSDDNPYSESLFKTLKYVPEYPEHFNSLGDAKQWTMKFVEWYNNRHLHSGIKFVTPADRHQGLDIEILEQRHEVYLKAKAKNPARWNNRKTRNWDRIEEVHLNYLQGRSSVV
jgi:transposase InsO family protein